MGVIIRVPAGPRCESIKTRRRRRHVTGRCVDELLVLPARVCVCVCTVRSKSEHGTRHDFRTHTYTARLPVHRPQPLNAFKCEHFTRFSPSSCNASARLHLLQATNYTHTHTHMGYTFDIITASEQIIIQCDHHTHGRTSACCLCVFVSACVFVRTRFKLRPYTESYQHRRGGS